MSGSTWPSPSRPRLQPRAAAKAPRNGSDSRHKTTNASCDTWLNPASAHRASPALRATATQGKAKPAKPDSAETGTRPAAPFQQPARRPAKLSITRSRGTTNNRPERASLAQRVIKMPLPRRRRKITPYSRPGAVPLREGCVPAGVAFGQGSNDNGGCQPRTPHHPSRR